MKGARARPALPARLVPVMPDSSLLSAVRQLGDPILRVPCPAVADPTAPDVQADAARLHAALAACRAALGFGRAIAAPQLGIQRRMVALNLGLGPLTLLNPEITWRSAETRTLWDDCLSFPDLLVRVRRHISISVRFQDPQGAWQAWEALDWPTSELLQHELDHLDGVLAVDRAEAPTDVVTRAAFTADQLGGAV